MSIRPDRDISLSDLIKQKIIELNYQRPSGDNFEGFRPRQLDGAVISDCTQLLDQQTIIFDYLQPIIAESSSSWKQTKFHQLNLREVEISVPEYFNKLRNSNDGDNFTQESEGQPHHLIAELKDINYDGIVHNWYVEGNRNDESGIKRHPIAKALYLMSKYSEHESAVDSFLNLLLFYVGYYEDWLFPMQQLRLPLIFGNARCESIADFTIFDVLSFYRMAVVEDKSVDQVRQNSLFQLIAEAIAMHQRNNEVQLASKRRKTSAMDSNDMPGVIGVRVSGFRFWFYIIPITEAITEAMETQISPSTVSDIYRLGGNDGYDFLSPDARANIIQILDHIRRIITRQGANSVRRPSK